MANYHVQFLRGEGSHGPSLPGGIMNRILQIGLGLRDRTRFFLNRARERLWVKPLMICLLSILAVFLAKIADHISFIQAVPEINPDSIEKLLTLISASMLVIAVFAVGAMLSAYASASNAATPRSFSMVIADDVSQNALSTFIGSFIFSIVALIALMNGYYEEAGRFTLFLVTIVVFAIVILSFIRWVDCIARLGRLGTTIDKVEAVTASTLRRRCQLPTLGATRSDGGEQGIAIYGETVGYVQRIDVAKLQAEAEKSALRVTVAVLPGTFVSPSRPLAYVSSEEEALLDDGDVTGIIQAFVIGGDRTFDEDPRFGLIVLSEIASRALSPAVNDPGTAIDIIGTLVRLFTIWTEEAKQVGATAVEFDRVAIVEISLNDMFDDAFNAIARDGAGTIEVAIRLQKAFHSLASLGDDEIKDVSIAHAQLALRHAELALKLPEEIESLRRVSRKFDFFRQEQSAYDTD